MKTIKTCHIGGIAVSIDEDTLRISPPKQDDAVWKWMEDSLKVQSDRIDSPLGQGGVILLLLARKPQELSKAPVELQEAIVSALLKQNYEAGTIMLGYAAPEVREEFQSEVKTSVETVLKNDVTFPCEIEGNKFPISEKTLVLDDLSPQKRVEMAGWMATSLRIKNGGEDSSIGVGVQILQRLAARPEAMSMAPQWLQSKILVSLQQVAPLAAYVMIGHSTVPLNHVQLAETSLFPEQVAIENEYKNILGQEKPLKQDVVRVCASMQRWNETAATFINKIQNAQSEIDESVNKMGTGKRQECLDKLESAIERNEKAMPALKKLIVPPQSFSNTNPRKGLGETLKGLLIPKKIQ